MIVNIAVFLILLSASINPFVINNIYSHILNDKSNWVPVSDALTYLKELKNKI